MKTKCIVLVCPSIRPMRSYVPYVPYGELVVFSSDGNFIVSPLSLTTLLYIRKYRKANFCKECCEANLPLQIALSIGAHLEAIVYRKFLLCIYVCKQLQLCCFLVTEICVSNIFLNKLFFLCVFFFLCILY